MIQKLKLIISEQGKNMDTVLEETISDPSLLYKFLDEFRLRVNAALTKLIEENGDIEEGEDSNSENEENEEVEKELLNHKRKKKKCE